MKGITILFIVFTTIWICPQGFSQERQHEVDSLIVLFKSADRDWNTLADQLIAIGEPAVLPLIGVLQDSSQTPWTRRIAAMTLNSIHSQTYVEPALQLLIDRSETPQLRNQVTMGLKGYNLSHASDELWKIYLEEENVFFRLNIADILRTSDPFLAYQAYEELYFDSDGYCKQQALKNLVKLRPHESLDLYIAALQSDDWMTANLAMDSLVAASHFTSGRIIRLYHRSSTPELVRWRIIRVMGQRPEKNHLDLHLEALSDPGWLVHNEAALTLSRMPRDQVLPELRYLEQSGDMDLVRRAEWVISQFKEESSQELAPMQPFDGYPMLDDIEEIKDVLRDKCVDTITFRKGEIIADVGAGNGYLEAMLSFFHDDLTFYIQDIDSVVCNPNTIQEVVDFYQEVNGKPFNNRFITVNGTDTDTNLPDQTFDKILMLWTYQYLKSPREFIIDLRKKLKNDGLLYVINPDQDYKYGKLLFTEYGWNMATVERQISDIIDGGFELVGIARNYDDSEHPYIMVFKKK
ncbi:MAG: HEAT repeat domain-containing protein [Bacteroidota bacterium]